MRNINLLTEKEVKNAKPDEGKFVTRIPDGGNLYLQVTQSVKGYNKNWIFRYELHGVRHDLGIGPLSAMTLAQARRRAADLRLQIVDAKLGKAIDPAQERVEARKALLAERAKEAKAMTFEECAQAFYEKHQKGWKNDVYRRQWMSNMERLVYPTIGKLNIADIDHAHIEKVLTPIWEKIPATASRVQGQIARVFDWAVAGKLCSGDNPADRKFVTARLGKPNNGNGSEHHPAMPFAEVPAFMAQLRPETSLSGMALQFTILTAVRTGDSLGATWDEIDLRNKVWTIPAARMKMDREHRVPLTDRAIEILKWMEQHRKGRFIFANAVTGKPLADNGMLDFLKNRRPDCSVHGFRATFRTWAGETTSFPHDICEAALAHIRGDKSEQAYNRGDLFVKRARLMKAWAEYLSKPQAKTGDVVDLKSRRA